MALLVNELNISNEDLVNEWEAYQFNNNNAPSITQSSFKHFSKHLRFSRSAKIAKKTRSRSHSNNNSKFIHNNHTLKPLMENTSKPNANNNNNDFDKFLNMATPSKSKSININKPQYQTPNSSQIIPLNIMQSPAPINSAYKSRKEKAKLFVD